MATLMSKRATSLGRTPGQLGVVEANLPFARANAALLPAFVLAGRTHCAAVALPQHACRRHPVDQLGPHRRGLLLDPWHLQRRHGSPAPVQRPLRAPRSTVVRSVIGEHDDVFGNGLNCGGGVKEQQREVTGIADADLPRPRRLNATVYSLPDTATTSSTTGATGSRVEPRGIRGEWRGRFLRHSGSRAPTASRIHVGELRWLATHSGAIGVQALAQPTGALPS